MCPQWASVGNRREMLFKIHIEISKYVCCTIWMPSDPNIALRRWGAISERASDVGQRPVRVGSALGLDPPSCRSPPDPTLIALEIHIPAIDRPPAKQQLHRSCITTCQPSSSSPPPSSVCWSHKRLRRMIPHNRWSSGFNLCQPGQDSFPRFETSSSSKSATENCIICHYCRFPRHVLFNRRWCRRLPLILSPL